MNIDTISTTQNQTQASFMLPSDCMKFILTNNFDVVSIPAIITIFKYVANIASHPNDDKYLTINTKNKVFLEKIYKAKGAIELLKSIGFQSDEYGNLTITKQSNYSISDNNSIQSSLELLQNAMNELQIPDEDQPKINLRNNIIMQESTIPVTIFDPYKTYIVRNNLQPIRQDDSTTTTTLSTKILSTTEMQLVELQKRRLQIEGKIEDVERQTQVLYPREDGTVPSMDIDSNNNTDNNNNNNNNNDSTITNDSKKIIQKEVLQKIIAMKKSDHTDDSNTGPPLTTQAIKDLQKAQKERIYNKTLIRIKFPDRVCLQGYFHPRHCISDVYDWVNSCLALDKVATVTSSNKDSSASNQYNKKVDYAFELYIAPPRTVLIPYKEINKRNTYSMHSQVYNNNNSNEANISHSLSELKLVPATLIYLSWKQGGKGHAITTANNSSDNNITNKSNGNCATSHHLGSYLKDDILSIADYNYTSISNNHNNISTTTITTTNSAAISVLYPKSELLSAVNTKPTGDIDDILLANSTNATEQLTSNTSTRSNKPKWFKT